MYGLVRQFYARHLLSLSHSAATTTTFLFLVVRATRSPEACRKTRPLLDDMKMKKVILVTIETIRSIW
jgi:hypothetical protein